MQFRDGCSELCVFREMSYEQADAGVTLVNLIKVN